LANYGRFLAIKDRGEDAVRTLRDAIRRWESLVHDFPNVVEYRQSLMQTLSNLGTYFSHREQTKDAEEVFGRTRNSARKEIKRFASSTVMQTADTGAGSLRDAIVQLNQDPNPGVDTIAFSIGSGAETIIPMSPLPSINHSVIIDGTTQPGFAGTPLIELDGAQAGSSANGLVIAAGNSTVMDLVINRFALDGILLQTSGGDSIQGD
jgi:hypothetical protein